MKQYQPEHIYLSNKEDLNNMIHETSDAFHFLKYKAESGDTESQVCVKYKRIYILWRKCIYVHSM